MQNVRSPSLPAITLNLIGLNSPIKDRDWQARLKATIQPYAAYKRLILYPKIQTDSE